MTFLEEPSTLIGWTIYQRPSDFPQHFVVRAWRVGPFGSPARGMVEHAPVGCLCHTLNEARAVVPHGRVNLHRWLNDDPVIVETWI